MPDITCHPPDVKSVTTETRNVNPGVTAASWSRVNWEMYNNLDLFSHHFYTIHWSYDHILLPFMIFRQFSWLCNDTYFSLQDGGDSTCNGRRVHAVQNKTPEL